MPKLINGDQYAYNLVINIQHQLPSVSRGPNVSAIMTMFDPSKGLMTLRHNLYRLMYGSRWRLCFRSILMTKKSNENILVSRLLCIQFFSNNTFSRIKIHRYRGETTESDNSGLIIAYNSVSATNKKSKLWHQYLACKTIN